MKEVGDEKTTEEETAESADEAAPSPTPSPPLTQTLTPTLSRRRFIKNGVRVAVALGAAKGVYNTSSGSIRTEQVEVRIKGLPQGLRGLKIAQLTDLHSSFIVTEKLLHTAALAAMAHRPDMIALTGDYISGSTKFLSGSVGDFEIKYLDRCVRALSPLRAPLGIYGVLGNHDFWSGAEAVGEITTAFEKRLGVKWLRNESVTVERAGATLDILGVDDHWEESYSLEGAYSTLGRKKPSKTRATILLSHNPDVTEDIGPSMKIDLILSGHTHGGQIVAPFIGMPFLPSRFGQKYRQGLVITKRSQGAHGGNGSNGVQTYVSRGVGHLLAPVRFNCPPEVTVITLA